MSGGRGAVLAAALYCFGASDAAAQSPEASLAQDLADCAGAVAAFADLDVLAYPRGASGAWAPLLYMYPDADVPVVQIAVQPELGPRHHVAMGSALRKLSEEGVLLIGSGHMTHNLRDWSRGAGTAQPYAKEFQAWVFDKLKRHDVDSLVDYRSLNPNGVRAHPTDEHFLPLHVAYGAAGPGARGKALHRSFVSGNLSMAAYAFS